MRHSDAVAESGETERQRERETERQTEREREYSGTSLTKTSMGQKKVSARCWVERRGVLIKEVCSFQGVLREGFHCILDK